MKIGPIDCPETSVINHHYSLRNNPEERSSHVLRDGSLKSRKDDTGSLVQLKTRIKENKEYEEGHWPSSAFLFGSAYIKRLLLITPVLT